MFRQGRKVALLVAMTFFFQIMAVPFVSPAQAADSRNSDRVEEARTLSFIKGKIASVTDIFQTLGKASFAKYLKSAFTKNISVIEERILKQVQSEGFEKFIADLDSMGPLGRSFADRFRNLPSEEARLETIRKSLHQNLKAMVGRVSAMDEKDMLTELQQTMAKVNQIDSADESMAILDVRSEPVIKFKSMDQMGLDGDYSEIFEKFFKGLKVVGIAGVVLLIASGGLLLSGHAAIGTVVIVVGAALAVFPVVIVVKIVRAFLNSF
ncbi:MAG: hypothetical protein CVV64_19600 [Candidatus Wallbacteria bacterium HGW-Wallbacteria-1]|jgi:hypothetical protein|uniref:Uncharacterized protein n=1 Tax=Candidatus Wallbacteria bacterium HGW-Wallbacteria-1 TaxID=2013854 RepID=A0A2N1PIV6_9BACT|nr:MAG: hypothetical protein CVV64_19600 [Candidatus Wallbacteria bacterium HGW-Wallbacteria-1]